MQVFSYHGKHMKDCLELSESGINSWITGLKKILLFTELGGIWENSECGTKVAMKDRLKVSLQEKYERSWLKLINKGVEGNKLRTYCQFKKEFKTESYTMALKSRQARSALCKFRISSHDLMIERGRYAKPHKLPIEERVCPNCKSGAIEDEMHVLLDCAFYTEHRKVLLDNLKDALTVITNIDATREDLFISIMSSTDTEVLKYVSDFILAVFEKRVGS